MPRIADIVLYPNLVLAEDERLLCSGGTTFDVFELAEFAILGNSRVAQRYAKCLVDMLQNTINECPGMQDTLSPRLVVTTLPEPMCTHAAAWVLAREVQVKLAELTQENGLPLPYFSGMKDTEFGNMPAIAGVFNGDATVIIVDGLSLSKKRLDVFCSYLDCYPGEKDVIVCRVASASEPLMNHCAENGKDEFSLFKIDKPVGKLACMDGDSVLDLTWEVFRLILSLDLLAYKSLLTLLSISTLREIQRIFCSSVFFADNQKKYGLLRDIIQHRLHQ